ncbi:hypothetical protein DSM112329_02496 [Paraconexibacter sp. AEG42_29]|uniref:histidine kinase n=1 Tax=Paraconexibacter sp. AEG42_29 TaxID=2997339 RepID=A0AAU7AVK9_9ACTN
MSAAPPAFVDALLTSIADGVYVVDADGHVNYVNPAGARILGYPSPDDLLGLPSHETIHAHRRDGSPYPEEECPLLRPRRTGETVHVDDDWFVRRDGSMVPVSYSSAPVDVDGGRGAVVAFRDVTLQRRAEADRMTAERDRVHALELVASRRRLIEAADRERSRLGRDLHDGAQQRLTSVAMTIAAAARRLPEGDPAHALVADALAEAKVAIAELRTFAAGLHPTLLTTRGLAGAVESLVVRMPLPVTHEVTPRRYPPELEMAAYFVVAEALANIGKHARATAASVVVSEGPDGLLVRVEDDGVGGADPVAGSGLIGLQDRVAALGGGLRLTPGAAGGTVLEAALPLG